MARLTPELLMRLVQIELRCMQECAGLVGDDVPKDVCDIMCQHAQIAHTLSERLWQEYGVAVHGHRPSALPPPTPKEAPPNDLA